MTYRVQRSLMAASLGVLLAFVGGCSAPSRPAVEPTTSEFPLTVTDSLGRSVRLERKPERIVTLAPSATEVLFAIGAGERIVGVTSYCNSPPEAKQRTVVGGFVPRSVSIEKVAALKPDLVVIAGRLQQPLLDPLDRLGLPVVALDASTLAEVADNIRLAGRITERSREAEQVAATMNERIEAVRRKTAEVSDRPAVLYLVSDEPLMAAGPKTFIGQLIELAGGANVFADTTTQYPRISDEEVLKRNPSVIVLPREPGLEATLERLATRPAWRSVTAIQARRFITVDPDSTSRPGPRLADALEALAAALTARSAASTPLPHPPPGTGSGGASSK